MLEIKKTQNNTTLTILPEGRLDTETAPLLEEEMKQVPATITELIMDLKNLEYISSAGLRVLLSAHRAMEKQGTMTVINPCDVVQEVFNVTGFSDILNIR